MQIVTRAMKCFDRMRTSNHRYEWRQAQLLEKADQWELKVFLLCGREKKDKKIYKFEAKGQMLSGELKWDGMLELRKQL